MKRFLLFILLAITTGVLHAQLEEDFSPAPDGWILSSGAGFGSVNGNNGVVTTPGVGGNNPASIGTPAVNKTSNTFKVCFDIYAIKSGTQVSFPANTFADVYFVKSSVTTANQAAEQDNILASQIDFALTGGTNCFTFTFPGDVTDLSFKVFLSFHSPDVQSGIKYVLDNVSISGVDELCGGGNCAPTALNDQFNRGSETALSFNAVLYGSNLDVSFPVPGPGVAFDAGGTDNDQNDDHSQLQWSVVSGPDPVLGSVFINPNGSVTINRTSTAVTQLTFTYRLTDDEGLFDEATVTVNWLALGTLPVSLLNYSASRSGSYVTLQWTTAMESNNTGFEIQRTNANGKYEKVGFVATKAPDGNSQGSLQYQFKELNTSTGLTWYRLVQIDKDGASKIYGAKGVHGMEASARVSIYPNPGTSGNMNVLFGSNAPRDILIADLSGKAVKSYISYQDGNLVISGLTSGIYTLMITNKATQEKQAHKMVIIK